MKNLSILSIDTWGENPIFHPVPDEANSPYGAQCSKVKVTCKSPCEKQFLHGVLVFWGVPPEERRGGGGRKKFARIFFHPPPCAKDHVGCKS